MVELPALPYAKDALEPHISRETLDYHYDKHHAGYVTKFNKAAAGTPFENASLEDVIRKAEGGVFNNGAQVWNHTFFWNSLKPGGGTPSAALAQKLTDAFGSVDAFKEQFTEVALGRFGSGWAWLVQKPDGTLAVENTLNADNPLRDGSTPLLTCDVWEHAYYIDYRNARPDFLEHFWQIVNWEFVEQNLG